MMVPRPRHLVHAAALVAIALAGAGCNVLGVAAAALPPPTVEAAYGGLAQRETAVIVWASPEVDVDNPGLTVQVGKRIESNLKTASTSGGRGAKKVLEGVSFPYPTESYARYLRQDPTLGTLPPSDLAARASTERVIYVELYNFTTRGGSAQSLVRGVADANLVVFEIDNPVRAAADTPSLSGREPASVREVYREAAIRVTFPEKGPEDGSNTLSPQRAYSGLIMGVADAVSKRFVPHAAPEF